MVLAEIFGDQQHDLSEIANSPKKLKPEVNIEEMQYSSPNINRNNFDGIHKLINV